MVNKILLVAGILAVINVSYSASAPPAVVPCKAEDSECIQQNTGKFIPFFGDGIPEFGVETLDPVFFEFVDASLPNLKYLLKNVTVTGLKTCKSKFASRDKVKSTISLGLDCVLGLDGDYELSGQVLILNIRGQGKIHVLLRQLVLSVVLDVVEKVGKDGEKHFRVKKFTHTYELLKKSDVVFQGLFEDNAVLSQAADELIKNNGNDIVREIGGKMFEAAITKVVKNINRFFEKNPIKDIAFD